MILKFSHLAACFDIWSVVCEYIYLSFLWIIPFFLLGNDSHSLQVNSTRDQLTVMENENELLSSLSFASSSYTSNGSSTQILHPGGCEPVTNPELLSLSKLSGCLEKLLLDAEYNYSDAEIVVEGTCVAVNRCILASRSSFFHDLFKQIKASSQSEGKPKYLMTELVPHGKIGYETFMVFLNYVYTGKLKPSPPEVSTCVDESCAHDACGPAINYAVELMYASPTFQMKELVMVVQVQFL